MNLVTIRAQFRRIFSCMVPMETTTNHLIKFHYSLKNLMREVTINREFSL